MAIVMQHTQIETINTINTIIVKLISGYNYWHESGMFS